MAIFIYLFIFGALFPMNRCNDVSQSMNEEEQHAGMEDAGH